METFFTKFLEWLYDVAERYIFPFHILRSYEAGVVLLFGKYHYSLKHGWNWKWPLIHESLTCLIKPETLETRPFNVMTMDEQTITISIIGCYEVADAKKWLLDANDAATNIVHHLIAVASDYLAEYDYEDLTRKTSYTPIKNKLNKEIEYTGAKFTMISYGSLCKARPISLINN